MPLVFVNIDNTFAFDFEDDYSQDELEEMARERFLELVAGMADDDFILQFEVED